MKKTSLFLAFCLWISIASAQLGTAHNFTVTDINGNSITLYDILDEGKVVVLDVSTTWCGTCWNLHNNHYLQDLHDKWGPDGTDQIRVIFYEGDGQTGMDALNGTGGNTLGDWVTGVTYQIVNESPIQLDLNVFAPQGFPTINIIRPGDYEIVGDPWNEDLAGMEAVINSIDGITLGEVTTSTNDISKESFKVFPNPAADMINVDLSGVSQSVDKMIISNSVGQTIREINIGENKRVEVEIAELETGFYFIHLLNDAQTLATEKFSKF